MFLDYSVGNGIAGMIKIEDRQFVRLPGYDRIIREQTWKVMTSLISALESNKKEKGNVDDRLRQLFLFLFYSYVHPFTGRVIICKSNNTPKAIKLHCFGCQDDLCYRAPTIFSSVLR